MVATAPMVRMVNGHEFPLPGTYEIDPGHSLVGFEVRHLMLTKTRGRFHAFGGTVSIAEDPRRSTVEVTIETASIDTANPPRDEHLRNSDFFGSERYPTIAFRGAGLELLGGGRCRLDGELTILGVTRPVSLEVEVEGAVVDPWGNPRVAFSATTSINREEWGMTFNFAPLESGGLVIGREVRITIEIEATRSAPAAEQAA